MSGQSTIALSPRAKLRGVLACIRRRSVVCMGAVCLAVTPSAHAQGNLFDSALAALDARALQFELGDMSVVGQSDITNLRRLAAAGSSEASRHLGCLAVRNSPTKALTYFSQTALWGSPQASFNWAVLSSRLSGDAVGSEGRQQIQSLWADLGMPEAGAWLLDKALAEGSLDAARTIAKQLPGDAAMVAAPLARLKVVEGKGEEALKWATRAAAGGYASVAALLSTLYRTGFGGVQDFQQATLWRAIADRVARTTKLASAHLPSVNYDAAVEQEANAWLAGHPTVVDEQLACQSLAASNHAPQQSAINTAAVAPPTPAAPPLPEAVAIKPVSKPPKSGTFNVQVGQSMADAWRKYGANAQIATHWNGPDLVAKTAFEIGQIGVEELGVRITQSARSAGTPLELRLYENRDSDIDAAEIFLSHTR